jgi:hypothetical protein
MQAAYLNADQVQVPGAETQHEILEWRNHDADSLPHATRTNAAPASLASTRWQVAGWQVQLAAANTTLGSCSKHSMASKVPELAV